ncbi:hypothetical protein QL285_095547 [Trifolium repens]|nr:hypothetical protein QL285_095547 [Trifolium repens]
MRVLVKLVVLVFLRFSFLCYSRSVEICRSQGVRSTSTPVPASYPYSRIVCSKELLCLLLVQGVVGTWFCSVLAVVPFAKI